MNANQRLVGLVALMTFSTGALSQEMVLLDGRGGMYSVNLASSEIVRLGPVGAPYVARSIAPATNRKQMYLGNGIEGEVWLTDPENQTSEFFFDPRDSLPVSNYFRSQALTTDGAGTIYVAYLTWEGADIGFVEHLGRFHERTGEFLGSVPFNLPSGNTMLVTSSMAYSPDSGLLYVVEYIGDIYSINPQTGELISLADFSDASLVQIAVSESDLYTSTYGVGGTTISKFDPETNEFTPLQTYSTDSTILGIAFVTGTPADLRAPYGELDAADVIGFVQAFGEQANEADMNAPSGVYDYLDVIGFLTEFAGHSP